MMTETSFSREGLEAVCNPGHRVGNVNGRRGFVLVLDFCRGQGRLAIDAPVDGLETLVDKPLLHHVREGSELRSLVFGFEGDVRIFPVPKHAKPLELFPLDVDKPSCVMGTLGAQFDGIHGLLGRPFLAEDAEFDGQTVGIPARDVGCAVASHPLVLGDEIFQDLVEGCADVDVGIGVGRAVVQDEKGAFRRLGHELPVKVHFGPHLQEARFPFGQVGPHWEIGLR